MKRSMIPSRQTLHNIRQSRSHLTSLGLECRARRGLAVALLAAFGVTCGLAEQRTSAAARGYPGWPRRCRPKPGAGNNLGVGWVVEKKFSMPVERRSGQLHQEQVHAGPGRRNLRLLQFLPGLQGRRPSLDGFQGRGRGGRDMLGKKGSSVAQSSLAHRPRPFGWRVHTWCSFIRKRAIAWPRIGPPVPVGCSQ